MRFIAKIEFMLFVCVQSICTVCVVDIRFGSTETVAFTSSVCIFTTMPSNSISGNYRFWCGYSYYMPQISS